MKRYLSPAYLRMLQSVKPKEQPLTPRKRARSPEHDNQAALFRWAAMQQNFHPELKWMHAIPNAAKRSARLARHMKAEGLKPGVWDIFLPVRRRGYGGMYIEMKVTTELTPLQKTFRMDLDGEYFFAVAYTWEQARAAVLHYLKMDPPIDERNQQCQQK